MSVRNNQSRTLSGLSTIKADQLELPQSRRAIAIKGQYGVAGDVLQKSATNKLAWGKIDDIEIPNGSIAGEKLKSDISINTTGDIVCRDLTSTQKITFAAGVNALSVGGNFGTAGLVLQKSAQNVLQWGPIDDIEIPDGSITGAKLASDIDFSTTGNIAAVQFNANNSFSQSGNALNVFNGAFQLPKITTVGDGIDIYNGGDIELFSDAGNTSKIKLDGSNGNITSAGGTATLNNILANNSLIVEGNGIYSTDINLSSNANSPYKINLDGSSGIGTFTDLLLTDPITTILMKGLRTDAILIPMSGQSNDVMLNDDGLTLAGQRDISANGSTLSMSNFTFTGAHGAQTGVIQGNVSIIASNGDTPQDGSLTVKGNLTIDGNTHNKGVLTQDGNINSTNGNITLTNGDITLTNGTFRGKVVGEIVEEHIAGTSLTLRTANPNAGNPTGLIMDQGNIDLTNNRIVSDSSLLQILGASGAINCNNFAAGLGANSIINLGTATSSTTLENECDTQTHGHTGFNTSFDVISRLITIGRITGGGITGSTNVIKGVSNSITGGGLIMTSTGGDIEGSNTKTDNTYNTNLKYCNLDGREISQSTYGNVQQNVSSLSANQYLKTLTLLTASDITLSATNWNFLSGFGATNVKVISTHYLFRCSFVLDHLNAIAGKIFMRIDAQNQGQYGYASSLSMAHLFSSGIFEDNRIHCESIVSGLTINSTVDFFPRFAMIPTIVGQKPSAALTFGGQFGPLTFDVIPIDSANLWTPV